MRGLSIILLISVSACLAAGCSEPLGPEQQIRELLQKGEEAIESGEIGELEALIDKDYRDAHGNDRRGVLQLLRLHAMRGGFRELVSDIDGIELIRETDAVVNIDVRYVSSRSDSFIPETGNLAVELELTQSRPGQWTIIGATWGRGGPPRR